VPSLLRLCSLCENSETQILRARSNELAQVVKIRFSLSSTSYEPTPIGIADSDDEDGGSILESSRQYLLENQDTDGDDSDGPTVVPVEEVDASMARSVAATDSNYSAPSFVSEVEKRKETIHRLMYPLLFAAKGDHEDILMTCARCLDEQVDVSLVREAAAYLEQVEAKRHDDNGNVDEE